MAPNHKLVFATHNRGKLAELAELLRDHKSEIELLTLDSVDVPDVEENGHTFTANASKKALEVSRHTRLPALADDSGLEVDALSGAPGIFSARYAGEPKDDNRNNSKLLQQMAEVPDNARGARFCSVLALAYVHGLLGDEVVTTRGYCAGTILREERGGGGFGYDPLFQVEELGRTFAEVSMAEKTRVSHRAKAMLAMKPHLERYFFGPR